MDHYLIEHCAPTLASIKTANLFRVSFDTQKNLFDAVRRWNNTLRDKGVLCFCLCLHEHTALIYVVRMSRLHNDLFDPAVGEFLSSFGYTRWMSLMQLHLDALLWVLNSLRKMSLSRCLQLANQSCPARRSLCLAPMDGETVSGCATGMRPAAMTAL